MWSAIGLVKAYWVSVSMFIFTTPYESASRISSSVEPDPPWKTRSNGLSWPYLAADGLLDLLQHRRPQFHVPRLVHAVDVAERRGQQVAALLAEPDRLHRLEASPTVRVQLRVDLADDAVLLAADDADLHLHA